MNNPVRPLSTFVATFSLFFPPALQMTPNSSHLGDSVCDADVQANRLDAGDCSTGVKPPVWPTVRVNAEDLLSACTTRDLFCDCNLQRKKDKTPRRTVISKRGRLTWSSEDVDGDQASTPKKMRLSRTNSREEMTVRMQTENRGQDSTAAAIASEGPRCVFFDGGGGGSSFSFSVSIKALEPYDVSE